VTLTFDLSETRMPVTRARGSTEFEVATSFQSGLEDGADRLTDRHGRTAAVLIGRVFSWACQWPILALYLKQETQLSLTNQRDAFIGQSRSPNIVPFHMLDTGSYCAKVTFYLRRAVFTIFDFKNVVTLKSGSEVTQGH